MALRIRSIVLVAAASGCAYQNPDFGDETSSTTSSASVSAGSSVTGQISTTDILTGGESDSASSGGNATIDGLGGSTIGTSDASTTIDTDPSTTNDTTSTTGTTGEPEGFDKQTLRNYNPDECDELLACTNQFQQLVPATHADTECFTPPVPGPVYVSRVGVNVFFHKATSPFTVEFRAYDAQNHKPVGPAVHSEGGVAIDADGYHEITVQNPVMFAEPAFCVTVLTGDNDAQVAIRIDDKTPGSDHSFIALSGNCETPQTPLSQWFGGAGHWCVNVDIQPTP